jgi:hypothetical protein
MNALTLTPTIWAFDKVETIRNNGRLYIAFEHLDFRTEGMSDAFFQECFISSLKDEIQAHVLMARPQSWVEATKRDKEAK